MNILRNILRFGLIAILVGLLVFLSIKIFKLIPKAINNLASATVSIGELNDEKTSTSTVVVQPTPTTAGGLNGVVIQPTPVATTTPNPTQVNPTQTNTQPTVPAYPTYQANPTPTRTVTKYVYPAQYYYPAPVSTAKNLKLVLTSIGVINSNGQYVVTNSFNSSDTISVRFKILNEENGPTGPWTMRVVMPAQEYNDRVKVLTNLSSIPGQSSYTAEARFTGIDLSQGNPTVYIYADPENQINESNENDNILSVRLPNVQTYTPSYPNQGNTNGNCYWQNGYYYCVNNGYYNGYDNGYNNNGYYNGNGYNGTNNNQCYSASYGYYTCNTDNGWNNGQSGTPNLTISTIETGRLVNGSFYQTTSIPYGERVSVRALVRNTGGYFSNSWSARLALNNQGTGYRELNSGYQSPIQSGGETYVYFEVDNLIRGNQTITVTADGANNVSEGNESDNSKTVNIYIN